jgi:hypothetical protein
VPPPDPAAAAQRPYRVALAPAAVRHAPAGLVLEVPHTTGTAVLRVTAAEGELRLDSATLALSGGRLVFPLASIRADDATLECHLREALGLDYARSRYPRDHVCERDRLPASGPDAIAFPEIVLDLARGGPVGGLAAGTATDAASSGRPLDRDGEVPVEAQGSFTVHGVTRPARLLLAVSRDPASPGALRVRGRHPFRLADFGVVVKPVKILFVRLTVGEVVTAAVDVRLVPRE